MSVATFKTERVGIGSAINRVDGLAKVTGSARYAAEHPVADLLYGYVVSSAIAKGSIVSIDTSAARAILGVVEIITHENRPHIAWFDRSYQDEVAPPGSPFRALYDDKIHFSAQPIALVVAESFEAARDAAALVDVTYKTEAHNTDFDVALGEKFMPNKKRSTYHPPKNRGDAETAFKNSELKIAAELSSCNRASQSDGNACHNCFVGWRRQDHRL